MNEVRAAYGLPMRVTSGFRTAEDQARVDPAHPQSMHTKGCAVDIYDPNPDKRLWEWCIEHMTLMVELGLYLEDKLYTPRHVHFQSVAPASGSRIFKP